MDAVARLAATGLCRPSHTNQIAPAMHSTTESNRLKRMPKISLAGSTRSASNQIRPNVYIDT